MSNRRRPHPRSTTRAPEHHPLSVAAAAMRRLQEKLAETRKAVK